LSKSSSFGTISKTYIYMLERTPRPHPEQQPKADFSRYIEAITELAHKMQLEQERKGAPIFRKIPLQSADERDGVRKSLNEGPLGDVMLHPKSKEAFKFSNDTQTEYIALMANTLPTEVGISIGYKDGKKHAIQTLWMSNRLKDNGQPMIERVTIKRGSDKIKRKEPFPANEKQAKFFTDLAQKLYQIYEAEQRDPYDWFD
jgi:hypothetical protein